MFHLILMLASKLGDLLDMLLSLSRHLSLQVFNLRLEFVDLRDQTCLVLLLKQSIFSELVCDLHDLVLQVLSGILTVSNELLILSNVFLKVIEDLEFLVESNERVQFVLELDLFLLQCELDLVLLSLVEHLRREGSRDNSPGRSGLSR